MGIKKKKTQPVSRICGIDGGFGGARGLSLDALTEHVVQFLFLPQEKKKKNLSTA